MWQSNNLHQDFSKRCALAVCSATMWQSDMEYLSFSWAVYSVTMWQSNNQHQYFSELCSLWQCDKATIYTKIFQSGVLCDNVTEQQSTPRYFWAVYSVTMWQSESEYTLWQCDSAKVSVLCDNVTEQQSTPKFSWAVLWHCDRAPFQRLNLTQGLYNVTLWQRYSSWWPPVHS